MAKKERSAEETYKRLVKKANIYEKIAPIVFVLGLIIAGVFIFIAVTISFGNVAEIITKLDSKGLTGEEIQQNYLELIEKYGEWAIGKSGGGFYITFVNIGRAVFSPWMVTFLVLGILSAISAVVLGKWVLPISSRSMRNESQNMVNLTVLRNEERNKE